MPTKSLFAAATLLCGLLAFGCGKEQPKQGDSKSAAPAPAAEATAWWKTEGQPGSQPGKAQMTGDVLPGWKNVNPALASKGKDLFGADCASCHTFGKGAAAGPDLQGITHRNTPEWTGQFVSSPETMVKSDPHAKELMNKYLVQMPNFHLTKDQVDSLNAFFRQQDQDAANKK